MKTIDRAMKRKEIFAQNNSIEHSVAHQQNRHFYSVSQRKGYTL